MIHERNLPNIFKESFKFGDSNVDLCNLLGEQILLKLRLKFGNVSDDLICVGLQELMKYLFLCSYSPNSLFFPGNVLIDDLWHALIIETASYRKLCNRIKLGNFVDHSGITFEDYLKSKSDREINIEQLSWLASYRKNFGLFTERSIEVLPLAKSILAKIGGGYGELNKLAESLILVSSAEQISIKEFNLDEFIESDIFPNATEIDSDINFLKDTLNDLVKGISKSIDLSKDLPSNSDLEKLFGASTALAFTFWQHLAVIERLQGLPVWQNKNQELWHSLVSGVKTCALATTHLAKPGGAGLIGHSTEMGFLVNGEAPWVCGYGIFDFILIGFETNDSIVFALTELPKSSKNEFTAETQEMICLNGTGTNSLKFNKMTISVNEVVSQRKKDSLPIARKTKYIIPELGIGKTALKQTRLLVSNSKHPRHILVSGVIDSLNVRLEEIETAKRILDLDKLVSMRDEFNRDAIRLLSIAVGAAALHKNSLVSRLHLETFLFDSVVHSPESFALKISKIGKKSE